MFSLLYGLWKYVFQREDYYVIILGLDNSGKTTFLEHSKIKFNRGYKGINLSRITSTVGLNVGSIDMRGGVRLLFWDLGGQKDLRTLWDKYYNECHGFIFVVDSSDQERLHEARQSFQKTIDNEALKGVPFLLVANKQDIEKSFSLSGVKEALGFPTDSIEDHPSTREIHAIGTSALTGEGINESITWIMNAMKNNSKTRPPRTSED